MEKGKNLYCAWADAGLALHNSGRCLLCCHSQTYLADEKGEHIYLDTGTIEHAWTSPTRREIQDALESGQQHPNCAACWNEEAAGRQSRRQVANEQFKDMVVTGHRPQLVDLKPGNTCNLACRSCWPEVSSKWYRDYWEIEAKKTQPDYREYLQSWGRIRTSYDRDNQRLWQDLEHWFEDVEYYDIYGAEPMLMDRVFAILAHSVESGRCQSQRLHINTNGTIWNQDYIDILTRFQRVNIDISVDGIDDKFAYLRYGETWRTLEENLDRYQELARTHSNIDLHICITVTSLNVLDVIEIQRYFCARKMAVFYNMVHHPQHLNVRSLPVQVKQQVRDRLNQQLPNWQITSIMDFMDMPLDDPERHWQRFCESTAKLDQLRDQDIRTTFPELWQLIEPYWINQ
jgi:sulfatase maturation enzyme AslB (radical SAM superfamily)